MNDKALIFIEDSTNNVIYKNIKKTIENIFACSREPINDHFPSINRQILLSRCGSLASSPPIVKRLPEGNPIAQKYLISLKFFSKTFEFFWSTLDAVLKSSNHLPSKSRLLLLHNFLLSRSVDCCRGLIPRSNVRF